MALRHLLLSSSPLKLPLQNPNTNPRLYPLAFHPSTSSGHHSARREVAISLASLPLSLALASSPPYATVAAAQETSAPAPSRSRTLAAIANTKSWFQFYGDGFSIRVPPLFEDIMEPEDYTAGFSYYGDKAKPKTFAARFASSDGSEVLSVVTRPSNQLKITFLEAKDISDLGTLKEVAKIFVPGRANIFSARSIKVKEDESFRTYYFYEFGIETQHVALVAAVNGGKAYIAGATAPQTKWEDDGVKLRSAAISLSIL